MTTFVVKGRAVPTRSTFWMGLFFLAATWSSAATQLTDRQAKGIDGVVRREMQARSIPGLQVALVRSGRIVFSKAYGVADLESHAPVTRDSVFTLNSSTKAFTGVAIMQLVQAGQVSLDAPVSLYLDNLPASWGVVTIGQLLTHVSGLPDILVQPKGQGTGSLVGDGSEASAWSVVQTMPVEAPAGTRYRYNQTNYVLLGKVIDHITGEPFTEEMLHHQFIPAGMKHTAFGDARMIMPGRVRTYRYAGGRVDTGANAAGLEHAFDDFSPFIRTAGGLNATADDVAHWLISLQNGTLLDKISLKTMWTAGEFSDGSPTPWAIGWPLQSRAEHPVVAGIGGRRAAFFVYPEDDLAIVLLTNLAGANPEEFIDEIAGQLYPDLLAVNGGGLSPQLKQLRLALIKDGFDSAPVAYARLKAADPDYRLQEAELNGWGGKLMGQGNLGSAICVFKLATELYADSANTHDSLAEAYEAAGEKTLAVASYKQSLALDAGNDHARSRLSALQ